MTLAEAIGWVGTAFIVPGAALIFIGLIKGSPDKMQLAHGLYAIGCGLSFVASVLEADALGTAINGLFTAWFTWLWWKNRRNGRRKRAMKDLGAKSRARIEAMVRQMTPSPIPSPVGGAA